MKPFLPGLVVALGIVVVLLVSRDQRVIIRCDCVGKYPAWMCEAFWWALC